MIKKLLVTLLVILTNVVFADKVLVLSDLHFTPYTDCLGVPLYCSKLNMLTGESIGSWEFKHNIPSDDKYETNSFMLRNMLTTFKNQIKPDESASIFVTGDMLSHGFNANFRYYNPFASHRQVAEFSAKTLLYVLLQIHLAFPKSKIYFVLGNNDTDNGDYGFPSREWLNKVARGLSLYIAYPDKSNFISQFSAGGYYSVALNDKVQIIGINNVIFSTKANNTPTDKVAQEELLWLKMQLLANLKAGKKTIILQHIPFGVNPFSSIKENKTVMLLNPLLQYKYINELNAYKQDIAVIYSGHFHSEYFQEVESIPVIGTMGLNRYFGNKAGLKLVDYDADSGEISKFTTYVVSFNKYGNSMWGELYSYPDSYRTKDSLATFISRFPYNMTNSDVQLYRANYDGNSTVYPQPIHNNKYWKYYFCAMNFINQPNYESCLRYVL